MSKQSEAKLIQGWQKVAPRCQDCQYFTSIIENKETRFGTYKKESDLRCKIGNFKTGKSSWCKKYEGRE